MRVVVSRDPDNDVTGHEMDSTTCGTCGLKWERSEKHPPCLKLDPETRREIGATAATLSRSPILDERE